MGMTTAIAILPPVLSPPELAPLVGSGVPELVAEAALDEAGVET